VTRVDSIARHKQRPRFVISVEVWRDP